MQGREHQRFPFTSFNTEQKQKTLFATAYWNNQARIIRDVMKIPNQQKCSLCFQELYDMPFVMKALCPIGLLTPP